LVKWSTNWRNKKKLVARSNLKGLYLLCDRIFQKFLINYKINNTSSLLKKVNLFEKLYRKKCFSTCALCLTWCKFSYKINNTSSLLKKGDLLEKLYRKKKFELVPFFFCLGASFLMNGKIFIIPSLKNGLWEELKSPNSIQRQYFSQRIPFWDWWAKAFYSKKLSSTALINILKIEKGLQIVSLKSIWYFNLL